MAQALTAARVRLDKWLWAARFFKTRALAAEAASTGRIDVNGQPAKPAREVRLGDEVCLRRPGSPGCTVVVLGLSGVRGPAPVAQALYRETPESIAARQRAEQARAQGVEPALGRRDGRPTARDRRQLAHWQRWSASLDDQPDSA